MPSRLKSVERLATEQGVTYAEKIGAADRLLDPARPAEQLERAVQFVVAGKPG